jgi:sulfoxide reductase catalytic subunit YedY
MSEKNPGPSEVTPESTYLNRRFFLKTSIFALSGIATAAAYRHFRPISSLSEKPLPEEEKRALGGEPATSFQNITHYNNFYEFSTDKAAVAEQAASWKPGPWQVEVGGLVEKPQVFSLADLHRFGSEERIYRFRCVEGWSMVIPWNGFPLHALLESAKPFSSAKYVAFTSYFDEKSMPDARYAGIPFPYVEGLRLDEALHPLTLLATGLYGKPLPNQNGAPLRLVVPWKYGFKSIKSVVKITLTEKEPPTTWNLANSHEYGFYSNVNPGVDHPRWSQAQERRIGELGLRPTLLFNGYEKEVASLYSGMDLRKYF